MEISALILAVAAMCSIPAGLVLVAVVAERAPREGWLRRHARAFAWFAAIGWAAIALRHWFSPREHSTLAAVAAVVAMLCMALFAMLRGDSSARPEPSSRA